MYRVYIVEDDKGSSDSISLYLKNQGWHVRAFDNVKDVKNAIYEKPHIWILNIKVLETEECKIICEIRKESDTPIICICSMRNEFDRVMVLELGCDDYLEYPFSPKELGIRCRKILERIHRNDLAFADGNKILLQEYYIDEDKRIVEKNNDAIEITSKQFDLLVLFAKNQGLAFSREQILNYIWGENRYVSYRVVDDLVRRIRSSLPSLRIETIYGFGYRAVKG